MSEFNNHPESEQIQAYLDDQLDHDMRQTIENHLQGCSTCQSELNKMVTLINRLENLPELQISGDFSSAVLSKLKEDQQIPSGITWTLIVEALAAGTVIGFLIPIIQAAAWLPNLLITKQEVLVAINIFFTQLASTWIIWWADIQMRTKSGFDLLLSQSKSFSSMPSPWTLIVAAGSLVILINFLLLRFRPLNNNNQY